MCLPTALGRPVYDINDLQEHAVGNLIETAYPDGTVSRMTYDELNHVLYTQDRSLPGSGGATTNAGTLNIYDGAGRVACVERLSGVILAKQANTSVMARSGADTIYQMTVTGAGSLVSFTRSVYDLDGRVMYSMAANGTVTEYDYDAVCFRCCVPTFSRSAIHFNPFCCNPPRVFSGKELVVRPFSFFLDEYLRYIYSQMVAKILALEMKWIDPVENERAKPAPLASAGDTSDPKSKAGGFPIPQPVVVWEKTGIRLRSNQVKVNQSDRTIKGGPANFFEAPMQQSDTSISPQKGGWTATNEV